VLGDVYPEDAQNPGVDRIVRRVVPRLTGGSILILHDGSPLPGADRRQTVAALEVILEYAEQAELRAVTVSNLLAEERRSGASDGESAPRASVEPNPL